MYNINVTKKYKYTDEIFELNTPNSNWLTGLLAADGHVQVDKGFFLLGLQERDVQTLKSVKSILNTDRPLYYRKPGKFTKGDKTYSRAGQYTLQVNSRQMVTWLIQCGFTRHKSHELIWSEEFFDGPFLNHFVRGYLDGDGSISLTEVGDWRFRTPVVTFTGTHHFIRGLQSAINKTLDLERGHIQYHEVYCQLCYTGPHSTMRLLEWLYSESTEDNRMSRKYDKYASYIRSGEWQAYLDRSKTPLSKISPDMAVEMRNLYDQDWTIRAICELLNCGTQATRDVIYNKSHVNFDGRTSSSTLYIDAFGEKKHISDWVEDSRCVVSEHTLYHRIQVQGMGSERALTQLPDKSNNPRTLFIEAFGETRSLRSWSERAECEVPYPTLYHRIIKLHMRPEDALTIPAGDVERVNHPADAPSNNAQISWANVRELRAVKSLGELTNRQISEEYGVSIAIVNDVVSGRSWKDDSYTPPESTQGVTQYYDYKGKSMTLTAIAKIAGVPKPTIDRRLRSGMNIDEATQSGRMDSKPYNLPEVSRTGLTAEKVHEIRQDYLDGVRGQASYEKHGLTKSRYMDIVLNRTWKSSDIWWKDSVPISLP